MCCSSCKKKWLVGSMRQLHWQMVLTLAAVKADSFDLETISERFFLHCCCFKNIPPSLLPLPDTVPAFLSSRLSVSVFIPPSRTKHCVHIAQPSTQLLQKRFKHVLHHTPRRSRDQTLAPGPAARAPRLDHTHLPAMSVSYPDSGSDSDTILTRRVTLQRLDHTHVHDNASDYGADVTWNPADEMMMPTSKKGGRE